MPKGMQARGIARLNKMLSSAVKLFLENGYEKTTTTAIASAAGMSPSSFFAAFESKEALLLVLVQKMFDAQFDSAKLMTDEHSDPLMLYCVETATKIHIAELSEPLCEMYVMAYSLPTTSEYIYQNTAKKLEDIFGEYLPEAQDKDFYELEIASAGVIRGFMARQTDFYFTVEQKLRRCLDCCMTLYNVPAEKRADVISEVLSMDLCTAAENIIADITQKADAGFESVMSQA